MKVQQEKALEIQKAKDSVYKEKDLELRQAMRSKEEDIKQLRHSLSLEKEDAVKV